MNTKYTICAIFFLILFCISLSTSAVHVKHWYSGFFDNLDSGDLSGISLSEEGVFELAPEITKVLDLEQSVFSILQPNEKTYIIGTGGQSLLYSYKIGEKPEILNNLENFSIHSVKLGPHGHIFVTNQKTKSVDKLNEDGSL